MTGDHGELALTARSASVEDLVALLRGQQARKVDVVAPASAIRAEDGLIMLDGTVPLLGPDGVTMTAGAYRPTDVCDQGIADKLGIPAAYLRRMRASRPGLFDANVNGWLAGDDRSFFVRCLRGDDGDDGETGVARVWLSDGWRCWRWRAAGRRPESMWPGSTAVRSRRCNRRPAAGRPG